MKKQSPESHLFDAPAMYKICVRGVLKPRWSERLEGMDIRVTESPDSQYHITMLEGVLLDQAALSGVLNTLYNLHLPVLSVERMAEVPG